MYRILCSIHSNLPDIKAGINFLINFAAWSLPWVILVAKHFPAQSYQITKQGQGNWPQTPSPQSHLQSLTQNAHMSDIGT